MGADKNKMVNIIGQIIGTSGYSVHTRSLANVQFTKKEYEEWKKKH